MKHGLEHIETHHMVDDEKPLILALQEFRMQFPYTRVMVYDEYMVYRIRHRLLADSLLKEALELIRRKDLPLDAFLNLMTIDATLIIKAKNDHN